MQKESMEKLHPNETIICPNCGSEATGNYCYQCGQETHLHKETFGGLIMHFLGHYFHYDSKFWMTIKALWFAPGRLTLAYWDRQRMRYIAPISLYIFISAVYFLVGFSFPNEDEKPLKTYNLSHNNSGKHSANPTQDSVTIAGASGSDSSLVASFTEAKREYGDRDTNSKFDKFIYNRASKISREHGDGGKYMKEKLLHSMPKIFFFMIPVLGLILKLLFVRRKNLYFVDHTIFALHYHSFWFSVMVLQYISITHHINFILKIILFFAVWLYLIIALKNVYKTSTLRSVFYSFVIASLYGFAFAIVLSATALLIFCMV